MTATRYYFRNSHSFNLVERTCSTVDGNKIRAANKKSTIKAHVINVYKSSSFLCAVVLLFAFLGCVQSAKTIDNLGSTILAASSAALSSPSTLVDVASVLVESNRTSLVARVALADTSATDAVYCAAFPTTYTLSSVAEVTNRNYFATMSNGAAVVAIPGLYAATNYKVYCTTATAQGETLTLELVKASATSAATQCCKLVTVNILHRTLVALTSIPSAISITVDAPPSESLRAVVSLGGGSTYPSLFIWTPSSSAGTPQMLIANAGLNAGAQQVTIDLSGTSAAEYSVRYVNGRSINVIPSTEEPALPELQSVKFSDDGTYVSVVFNAPTNQGGLGNSFPCAQLLSFSGSATSSCQWADSATIRIYPQAAVSSNLLIEGSEVTVVGEKITADCSAISTDMTCDFWQKVPTVKILVSAPDQPAAPVVSISAPVTVSVCNSLTVDLAGSSGSAGRSWSSVAFRVSISGEVTPASLQMQNFLNQNYTLNPPTTVPSTLLQAGTVYSIQVTLCNFLGACGLSTVSVSVLQAQDLIPIVSVLGAKQRAMVRSATLTLTSNAFTQACGGSPSYSNLDLTWTISSSTGDAKVASIRSSSVDSTVFRLAPFTLNVGHQYSVVLTVRSRLSGLSSTAAVTVTVPASNLVAKIAGGAQRSLKYDSSITLDASRSYDEDVEGLFGVQAGLSYMWSCSQIFPEISEVCPLQLLPSGPDNSWERPTIIAPLAALNTTSILTVTVRDASMQRSSTAQVSAKVTGFEPAVLSITSALESVTNVNTDNKLVLYGSVQTLTPCTAVWSVSDANVHLNEVTTTPTSVLLPASVRPAAVNLVVAGGTLPQRATLVFTLTCGSSANSLSVTTNGAPLPGVFLVAPSEGDELSTLFQFSAAQWTDPDLPLTYQFGFQSVTSLSNLVVVSVSELSFTSSKLPAGAEDDTDRLNCTLDVFDSFGASTLALQPVEVSKISESEQRDALLLLVKSGTGSVDSVKNIISVVSAAMNSVNCSAAPNCTEINRNPCSKTSGECGTCIDGYIGDYGDRSTLCIPASFAHSNETDAVCSTQVDCLSWQECDSALQICVSPQKRCSKDCSDNGECLFTSLVTGDTLSACSLADLTCAAACSCSNGFSGPTCATPLSDLQSRREIRSNLVTALYNLTTLENADKQSVSAWSASLYSVALNPYDLSVSDAAKVLQIANSTLMNARELVLDSAASLVGVLQATDTVFSAQKSNYIPNDFDDFNTTAHSYQNNTAQGIIEVVSAFAELQSQFMVLGEASATYFYDNFRVSSQLAPFGGDAANVTISSPQSDFERLTDTAVASAVLTPSGDSSGTTSSVSVSVIAVSPRAYSPDTANYKSNPLYLQITADSGEEVTSAVSNIEFSFPFNERQDQFVSYQPVNFTFFCDHLDDAFSFKCPDSGTLLTSDCSQGRGEYTKFCPKPSPTCAQLDTASAEVTVAESCRVVAYNATYVTCSCSVIPTTRKLGFNGRRASAERDIIDKSGASNMIATAAYISMEFADTFNAAGDFTDPAAVLIVIIMFATLWGAGLVLLSFCFGKSYMAMQKKLNLLSQQVISAISNVEAGQSLEDARDRLLLYIDNVIPSVYSDDKSNAVRLFGELRSHHRYLTLFTLGDGQKTTFNKILLILQVLTMETMQMFLLAMFYDLEQPDDDKSCPTFLNEGDCLDRKSIFDPSQSYCQWTVNPSTSQPTCSFHDPDMSGTVFLYILILTSIFTAIINTPLDHFFKVCAAPLIEDTIDDQVVNSKKNDRVGVAAVSKGLRRLSVQTNQAMRAAGRRGAEALVTTQKLMQKKFSLKSLHLSSKEKEADNVIADRAISEDLQQMHKHAVAGMTGLVQHTNTLQDQRERHSQRLLQKAQSKRNMTGTGVDAADEDGSKALDLREARKNTDASMISSTHKSVSATQISLKSTSGPEAGVALRKVMLKLQDEVLCQRLLLPAQSSHLVAFDAQWGIVPVSDDVYHISDEALDTIAIDVEFAEKEAKELSERMQHGGLSILNLFLVDLLGRRTIAAKIFKNKFEEDFQETRAVSQAYKAFAVALLLVCNAFFIYYTLLKALQKGHSWQVHFLQGCIAQMLVEIFLNETLECVWLNYMVPDLARKEVQRVHTVLRQVIEQITDKANDVHKKTVLFLNAPSYLFSSTKVAQSHAHLLESVVVLNFQSHLPGELSRTWPHYKRWAAVNTKDEMLVDPDAGVVGDINPFRRVRFFLFQAILAVSTATVLSMQYLGTLSFNIQRIVIRFIQPVLLSALTLLWIFASTSPIALYVVIGVTALFLVAVFYRQHYMHELEQRALKQIVPVDERNDLRDSGSEQSSDDSNSSNSTEEEEDTAGNLHKAKVKKSQYVSKKFRAAAKSKAGVNAAQDSEPSDSDGSSGPRHQSKKKKSKSSRRAPSPSNDSSCSSKSQPSSRSGLQVSITAGALNKHRQASPVVAKQKASALPSVAHSSTTPGGVLSETSDDSNTEDGDESSDDSSPHMQRFSQRISHRVRANSEAQQSRGRGRTETWGQELDEIMQTRGRGSSDLELAENENKGDDSGGESQRYGHFADIPLDSVKYDTVELNDAVSKSESEEAAHARYVDINALPDDVQDNNVAEAKELGDFFHVPEKGSNDPMAAFDQIFPPVASHSQSPKSSQQTQALPGSRSRAETWGAELDEIMQAGSDEDPDLVEMYEEAGANGGEGTYVRRRVKSTRTKHHRKSQQRHHPEGLQLAPPKSNPASPRLSRRARADSQASDVSVTNGRASPRARADSHVSDGSNANNRGPRTRAETWGDELDEIMRAGSDDSDDPDVMSMYDDLVQGSGKLEPSYFDDVDVDLPISYSSSKSSRAREPSFDVRGNRRFESFDAPSPTYSEEGDNEV